MALILTVMETRKGVIAQESLGALAVGREIASSRGATLYAVLLLPAYERMQQDLVVQSASCGADRIILVTQVEDPPAAVTWLPALQEVVRRFPPTFLLFGATRLAAELAPCLAAQAVGLYVPVCTVTTTPQLKIDWHHFHAHANTEFFEEDIENAMAVQVHRLSAGNSGSVETEVIPIQAEKQPAGVVRVEELDGVGWSTGNCVVMGSMALHRAADMEAWCRREECAFVRLGDEPAGAIPWWAAEPAGHGLLLVGCTADELALCQAAFPMFTHRIAIGGERPAETLWLNLHRVEGEPDAAIDAILQKEM